MWAHPSESAGDRCLGYEEESLRSDTEGSKLARGYPRAWLEAANDQPLPQTKPSERAMTKTLRSPFGSPCPCPMCRLAMRPLPAHRKAEEDRVRSKCGLAACSGHLASMSARPSVAGSSSSIIFNLLCRLRSSPMLPAITVSQDVDGIRSSRVSRNHCLCSARLKPSIHQPHW